MFSVSSMFSLGASEKAHCDVDHAAHLDDCPRMQSSSLRKQSCQSAIQDGVASLESKTIV